MRTVHRFQEIFFPFFGCKMCIRDRDKNVNIVPQPMFVLTYYEKHDDVKRQVNYYKFIVTLNNQKVLPGRLIITNEEAPLTEEQATKHFASIDEQTAATVSYTHLCK